ncbi:hypothetical protein [Nocardia sp. XZ_19_385]|uniref:hypothetical protein n=1 Tax=Nocardia sp. XZ_19_385 TaxID=2769488 RepID=UPI00188F881B|nr:hypothetical protein [Nocardia sp. XZ_19_385]
MRGVLKIAAVSTLPIFAAIISAGPAAANPLYFDSAHATGTTPGCAGTVNAEITANQGQQARDFANFIDSSTRVTVNFKPDPNPLTSLSANSCEVSTTVTMTNLDTGATLTETRTTQYDGHYGWHAAFFTLNGSGRVAVQVSTNPSPPELVIDVPAPY